MSMTVTGGLYGNYAIQNGNNNTKRKEVKNNSKQVESTAQNSLVKKPQLSAAAQKLLEKLQKTYDNMDFMVYENGQDAKELLSQSTKEITVLFSGDELEKMASDEKYEQEYMERVQGALRMSEQINREFGFTSAFGEESENGKISKIGISFNSDGTTSFFAELEKSSARQREHIEKVRDEKRTERKKQEKKAENESLKNRYMREDAGVKRTIVQADSMEELLKKIRSIDWDSVKTEKRLQSGGRFDSTI